MLTTARFFFINFSREDEWVIDRWMCIDFYFLNIIQKFVKKKLNLLDFMIGKSFVNFYKFLQQIPIFYHEGVKLTIEFFLLSHTFLIIKVIEEVNVLWLLTTWNLPKTNKKFSTTSTAYFLTQWIFMEFRKYLPKSIMPKFTSFLLCFYIRY